MSMRIMWWIVCAVVAVVGATMPSAAQAAMFPYVNDFTSTGFTHVNQAQDGVYTLDTAGGVLNYNKPTGTGTAASSIGEEITGIGTSDFVMSTRFTLNDIDLAGSLSITIGLTAFSSASTFASADGPFYLADWGVGGTSGLGNLRILALGDDSDFSAINANSGGGGTIGASYELRLTGAYTGGALSMTLALLDDAGNQLGTAATATDTSPLTGQFFGLRHRTANTAHFIDIDHHDFRLVPEASSVALVIAGIIGLIGSGRKSLR